MARRDRHMNLGLVTTEFPPQQGGMSELAYRLAEALALEIDVMVAVPGHLGPTPGPFRHHPTLSDGGSRDAKSLNDLEVSGWMLLQAGLLPLARRLSRPAVGYVHGNDFLMPWLPCGRPWIEAVKRPYASRLRHAHRRRQIARSLSAVRHVYANSSGTRELFLSRIGARPESVSVLPPGVPEDCFSGPHTRRRDPASPLRLLTVARLTTFSRRKNVEGVLRALSMLPHDLVVSYRVVGDGNDRARLENLADELGLAGCVEFLGAIERERLLAEYREADLFVMTPEASEHDVEGFGIVYLEANAAGVPVLGSRAGGAVDAIADGVSGILLEDSSSQTIAAAIRRFAGQRDRLSTTAIIEHARRYRWATIVDRLLEDLPRRLGDSGDAMS
jgi:phosphatidyl-myo-inositol dimannoside synthase